MATVSLMPEDWRLPMMNRIDDLISQMTLEEKCGLLVHLNASNIQQDIDRIVTQYINHFLPNDNGTPDVLLNGITSIKHWLKARTGNTDYFQFRQSIQCLGWHDRPASSPSGLLMILNWLRNSLICTKKWLQLISHPPPAGVSCSTTWGES